MHPFTCLIAGSSGVGKTELAKTLILSNRISNIETFSRVYYFFPTDLDFAPIDWAETFEDIEVSFHTELPDETFYSSVKPDSLVVFDDDFYRWTKSDSFAKGFRVFARKYRFSIIAITQNYFGGQQQARSVRNNCDVHILMHNYGDASLNLRAARSLGYERQFREASQDAYEDNHGYVLIFTGPKVQNNKLRVQTGFFREKHNYCYY